MYDFGGTTGLLHFIIAEGQPYPDRCDVPQCLITSYPG